MSLSFLYFILSILINISKKVQFLLQSIELYLTRISMWKKEAIIIFLFVIVASYSLRIAGQQQISFSETPFKNIRFIEDSIFFTAKNQKSFGYINGTQKGKIQSIYILDEKESIVDDLQNTEHVVVANQNKSLIYLNPLTRTLTYDDRFVSQNFTSFISYKKVGNKQMVLTQDAVRLYEYNQEGVLVYRELLTNRNLNPGITEKFITLFAFPTTNQPNRIVTLTQAKISQQGKQKLVICFKWFKQNQNFKLDGICHYDTRIDIKSIDSTDGWIYLRNDNQTYVFDSKMTMKTKWPQVAQQFHGGQAMLETQMTYLFKSNQIAYFRTINNFENNLNYKMTVNPQSLIVFRKDKRMVKITKSQDLNPIGVWVKQLKQTSFKLLVQFDNMHLHYYKIVKSQASTQINYLFRNNPKEVQKPVSNIQDLDESQAEEKKQQVNEGQVKQQAKTQQIEQTQNKQQQSQDSSSSEEVLAIAPSTQETQNENTQL